MGLMLSVLVVCVGVLEAISCLQHIRYSVLPVIDIKRKKRRLFKDLATGTAHHADINWPGDLPRNCHIIRRRSGTVSSNSSFEIDDVGKESPEVDYERIEHTISSILYEEEPSIDTPSDEVTEIFSASPQIDQQHTTEINTSEQILLSIEPSQCVNGVFPPTAQLEDTSDGLTTDIGDHVAPDIIDTDKQSFDCKPSDVELICTKPTASVDVSDGDAVSSGESLSDNSESSDSNITISEITDFGQHSLLPFDDSGPQQSDTSSSYPEQQECIADQPSESHQVHPSEEQINLEAGDNEISAISGSVECTSHEILETESAVNQVDLGNAPDIPDIFVGGGVDPQVSNPEPFNTNQEQPQKEQTHLTNDDNENSAFSHSNECELQETQNELSKAHSADDQVGFGNSQDVSDLKPSAEVDASSEIVAISEKIEEEICSQHLPPFVQDQFNESLSSVDINEAHDILLRENTKGAQEIVLSSTNTSAEPFYSNIEDNCYPINEDSSIKTVPDSPHIQGDNGLTGTLELLSGESSSYATADNLAEHNSDVKKCEIDKTSSENNTANIPEIHRQSKGEKRTQRVKKVAFLLPEDSYEEQISSDIENNGDTYAGSPSNQDLNDSSNASHIIEGPCSQLLDVECDDDNLSSSVISENPTSTDDSPHEKSSSQEEHQRSSGTNSFEENEFSVEEKENLVSGNHDLLHDLNNSKHDIAPNKQYASMNSECNEDELSGASTGVGSNPDTSLVLGNDNNIRAVNLESTRADSPPIRPAEFTVPISNPVSRSPISPSLNSNTSMTDSRDMIEDSAQCNNDNLTCDTVSNHSISNVSVESEKLNEYENVIGDSNNEYSDFIATSNTKNEENVAIIQEKKDTDIGESEFEIDSTKLSVEPPFCTLSCTENFSTDQIMEDTSKAVHVEQQSADHNDLQNHQSNPQIDAAKNTENVSFDSDNATNYLTGSEVIEVSSLEDGETIQLQPTSNPEPILDDIQDSADYSSPDKAFWVRD